jgi:hypothetical protein
MIIVDSVWDSGNRGKQAYSIAFIGFSGVQANQRIGAGLYGRLRAIRYG